MLRLQNADRIVGTRSLEKALLRGEVRIAYIAQDADLFISRKIGELCREKQIPVVDAPSMKALGEACRVDVPTACAGIRKS